jgi:voltage-gated potassium channel
MASSTASTVEALERVPLLAELTKRDRQRLAGSLVERTFGGRGGVGFFLIVEGKAIVSVGDRVVRALGPGDYFGEMALLDGNQRSATVTADTELRCLGMTSWNFKSFVQESPSVAWALLQSLAGRLREETSR